jgi:NodT family efflux transporter outer membrane factor (OMF) lipoprotein
MPDMSLRMQRRLLAVPLIVLAAGCAGTADREPLSPEVPVPVPGQWTAQDQVLPGEPEGWLADFDSPALATLVRQALEANFELGAAAARVTAARARADIAGAARLPTVDLELSAQRRKTLFQGAGGDAQIIRNTFGLDAGVSWEADLWGRLANETRAALAEADAALADYRAAQLSLAAEVARGWFAAVEAQQQLELAQRVVSAFRDSQEVIAARYRLGISEALDLRLARENTASAEATMALRQRERDSAIRGLQILLGRYPSAAMDIPSELPVLEHDVPAGLPSELLERRPDLIAARQRLLASSDRLRAANKNRLPSFRLTASGGRATDEFEELIDFDSLVWSLFASLVQPIYEGGRLKAERVLAGADNEEAWSSYAQTVLGAFREIETALAAELYLAEQERWLRDAAEEALQAAFLALDRYRQGLTDIITLLESQRRAVNTQSARLQVSRLRLENRVNLYLALGGPFETTRASASLESP